MLLLPAHQGCEALSSESFPNCLGSASSGSKVGGKRALMVMPLAAEWIKSELVDIGTEPLILERTQEANGQGSPGYSTRSQDPYSHSTTATGWSHSQVPLPSQVQVTATDKQG